MDLATTIQRLYDSEINLTISMLWDGGIEVGLVSYMEYLQDSKIRVNVKTAAEIAQALHDLAVKHFPDTEYVRLYGAS